MKRPRSFWTCVLPPVFLIIILACNLPQPSVSTSPSSQPTNIIASSTAASSTIPVVTGTISQLVSPTFTSIPMTSTVAVVDSPTPATVTVRASGGNLNIRRGPGAAYNPVGGMRDGQSSTATARNEDGSWLYISIPSAPSKFGWISTLTKYTSVSGDAMSLPLMTVEPAVPAYIQNCTFHEMLVKPAGVILPDQSNSPDNKQQFNPGDYTVLDETTSSQVADFTLLEGKTVDVKKDGLGTSYSCP